MCYSVYLTRNPNKRPAEYRIQTISPQVCQLQSCLRKSPQTTVCPQFDSSEEVRPLPSDVRQALGRGDTDGRCLDQLQSDNGDESVPSWKQPSATTSEWFRLWLQAREGSLQSPVVFTIRLLHGFRQCGLAQRAFSFCFGFRRSYRWLHNKGPFWEDFFCLVRFFIVRSFVYHAGACQSFMKFEEITVRLLQ